MNSLSFRYLTQFFTRNIILKKYAYIYLTAQTRLVSKEFGRNNTQGIAFSGTGYAVPATFFSEIFA